MMKQYLKQILSVASLFFCTLFPISAKHLKFNEANCLEVVLLDNLGISDVERAGIDVMLYGDSLHSKYLNVNPYSYFDLDGKRYVLDIKNIIIPESKFIYSNTIFLEIYDSITFPDTNENYTDVILYDIPALNKVSSLNKKYSITRNFTYNDKLYRIKAINKDLWDKYSNNLISILDIFFGVHDDFNNYINQGE